MRAQIKLWSINRWLRFIGFRVFVVPLTTEDGYTFIGIVWWGWPNDIGEAR